MTGFGGIGYESSWVRHRDRNASVVREPRVQFFIQSTSRHPSGILTGRVVDDEGRPMRGNGIRLRKWRHSFKDFGICPWIGRIRNLRSRGRGGCFLCFLSLSLFLTGLSFGLVSHGSTDECAIRPAALILANDGAESALTDVY